MPEHLHEDHVSTGLDFSGGSLTASGTLKYAGRYLDDDAVTDGVASFIDFDTEVNTAPFTLDLRDADHTAGMHYWIRVTSNSTGTLTVQRPTAGSTKTISGKFAGQTLSAATSVVLAQGDGVMRIKPDGDNWSIY